MAARRPLPDHLHDMSFTQRDLHDAAIPRQRVRAGDITPVGRGLYRHAEATPRDWAFYGHQAPGHGLEVTDLHALLRHHAAAILSHGTAAQIYSIPLPPRLITERTVHLSMPSDSHRVRRRHMSTHRTRLAPEDHAERLGLRLTSPERTWIDLASLAPTLSRDDLVIAGDYLVQRPWVMGVGRTDPMSTIQRLHKALERRGRFAGITTAREALQLVRVGADSPPETRTRLAMVDAGLPEPQLQVPADLLDSYSPRADLGLVEWKIALQYEGAYHRDADQQAADARRDAWFQSRGWLVIKVTAADLHDGFRRVLALVRERMDALSAAR